MSYINNAGSKWLKIDFHVHTPASSDYGGGDVNIKNHTTEEDILKSAMDKELDAIVIADHNSGAWIDKLKIKYEEIKDEFCRPLTIIPGVEITVSTGNNRVHILGIFDTNCTSDKIVAILGKCGIIENIGDANTSTRKSIEDVIKIIEENDGIAIPAHIDGAKGFLNGVTTINVEIRRVLQSISAAEFCDINAFENADVELKKETAKFAILAGSDAHTPSDIGKHSTWIKVSKVSKDELAIAFNDKDHYVLNQEENPNIEPKVFIESLEIHNMKHCGRGFSSTFKMDFHSHFNAIIGGRGSGKSTSLEAIRIVSDRINELNENSEMKKHLEKFISQSENGVMLHDTKLILEIKRNGKEYRIHWSSASEHSGIVEERQGNDWVRQEAGNIKERFPLNIYSQKQIHELAKNPESLLNIIDRAIEKSDWDEKWKEFKSRFMVLRERKREVNRQLALEPQIKTNLDDVINDLKQYESKGHGDVLKNYQIKVQQLKFVPLEDSFDDLARKIGEVADSAMQNDFPELQFQKDSSVDEVRSIYNETAAELDGVQKGLVRLVEKVKTITINRKNKLQQTQWYQSTQLAIETYNKLIAEYEDKNSHIDLTVYSQWVQKRTQLEQEINRINSLKQEEEKISRKLNNFYSHFKNLRSELFDKRKAFIDDIIGANNPHIRMEIVPFADNSNIDKEYRMLLGLDLTSFQSSILDKDEKKGILFDLYSCDENNLMDKIYELKDKTTNINNGVGIGAKFVNKIKYIMAEYPANLDQLWCWWPEDLLKIKYSRDSQGNNFENLEKGSAGQQAAAILAFLLSYGNDPLIIDQPEDDLDNALIYELIVKQIHKNKKNRQLIIVTHNANIVVNGDTELVHVMEFKNGQVQISTSGGIGEKDIREQICNIMEGGTEAFEKRYNRIKAGK